ncbi:hypothetical protein GE09DRAFT_1164420 [Coniochaeta sp. 2T2.1]|nr:hypothetical protein GE09DRAFT_1164420 [Coniochaeta sp. 2T2.1]
MSLSRLSSLLWVRATLTDICLGGHWNGEEAAGFNQVDVGSEVAACGRPSSSEMESPVAKAARLDASRLWLAPVIGSAGKRRPG